MEAGYQKSTLKQVLNVTQMITLHYFEFHKNYVFDGESHDFWEIAYVDRGEVIIEADEKGYCLKQGDLIFHKPGEFHTVKGTGRAACNLVIISFSSHSHAMRFFENKVFLVGDQERELISRILREGQRAYQGPLNVIHQKKLLRRKDAPFGAEQLIKLSLEALLIQFVRESSSVNKKNRLSYSMRDTADNQLIGEILDYLDQNLGENITITSLCAKFNLSPTYLKRLFREKVADSPIHHLILLRIAEAKRLIREEEQNFTQIAELTGFNSIHYFSRSFKAVTGMTPSEYAVSVKAMAQLE